MHRSERAHYDAHNAVEERGDTRVARVEEGRHAAFPRGEAGERRVRGRQLVEGNGELRESAYVTR
jgi:hypothetical protein